MILPCRTVSLFPKLSPEGNRVFCTKTSPTTDDEKFDIVLFCQVSIAILDLQLKEEPVYGNIILYDLQHVRLSQFLAFTPTLTKNLLMCCIVSKVNCIKSDFSPLGIVSEPWGLTVHRQFFFLKNGFCSLKQSHLSLEFRTVEVTSYQPSSIIGVLDIFMEIKKVEQLKNYIINMFINNNSYSRLQNSVRGVFMCDFQFPA